MTVTRLDALEAFFVCVVDNNTGQVTRIAIPADTQIGLDGNPAELVLTGRLALNVGDYTASSANKGTFQVDANDTIVSVNADVFTPASGRISMTLPDGPRDGEIHFVKNDSSTTAGTKVPIDLSTDDGSLIDGFLTSSILTSSVGGSQGVYWFRGGWHTFGGGGSGGSSTPLNQSFATVFAEFGSLVNSRQIASGTGITITDNGPGSTVVWSLTPSVNPGVTLDGLEWLLPRISDFTNTVYNCAANSIVSATLAGDPNNLYLVTLRFRGVVEERTYTGGTNDGHFFQIGGDTPGRGDHWNIYSLFVSSPQQTYYLNRGTSGLFTVFAPDYSASILIQGGANVVLTADSVDSQEIANNSNTGGPLSVPGITNPAQPYAGQFMVVNFITGSVVGPIGRLFVENKDVLLASGGYTTMDFMTGVHAQDNGSSVAVMIDNSVVATLTGSLFSGPVSSPAATGGFTGSLTQTTVKGNPFIIGSGSITVTTNSLGQVIVNTVAGFGNSIDVQRAGVSIPGTPFTALNLTGSGVLIAASGTGGTATVTAIDAWNDNGKTLVTTSSVSIDPLNRNVAAIGTDVFLFVSGTSGLPQGSAARKAAVLPDTYVSGAVIATQGFTGSLTQLVSGLAYIVSTGSVSITTNSLGQVVVSGSGGSGNATINVSGTNAGVWIDGGGKIRTTGSVAVDAQGWFAPNEGSDAYLWISGTIGLTGSAAFKAVFGGDIYGSGSITAGLGFSGSLTRLANGNPYLVAGTNVSITSQSNGSITINASAAGGGGSGDPNASYVVISLTGSLPNDRALKGKGDVQLIDGGPAAAVTLLVTGAWTDYGNVLNTSASVSVDSQGRMPSNIGTDVFFFVSGSVTSSAARSVFGGDTVVSGALVGFQGFSGSHTALSDGKTAAFVGLGTVTVTTNSSGQVIVSGSFVGNSTTVVTGSSLYVTYSLPVHMSGSGTPSMGAAATESDGTEFFVLSPQTIVGGKFWFSCSAARPIEINLWDPGGKRLVRQGATIGPGEGIFNVPISPYSITDKGALGKKFIIALTVTDSGSRPVVTSPNIPAFPYVVHPDYVISNNRKFTNGAADGFPTQTASTEYYTIEPIFRDKPTFLTGTLTGSTDGNKITTGSFSSRPAVATKGNLYFETDMPGVFEIDDSTTWQPLGITWVLGKPPASASWSNINQSATTTLLQQGDTLAVSASSAGTTTSVQCFYISGSATTPYTITVLMAAQTDYGTVADDYSSGLFVRSSGNSKLIFFGTAFNNSAQQVFNSQYTNNTTFSATNKSNNGVLGAGGFFWLRVKDNGIQRVWYTSTDGANFVPYVTEASTNFIGSAPDQVGIAIEPRGNGGITSLLSYTQTSP